MSPAFLHLDVKYLPAIDGEPRRYLFVAIDRATRWVYVALKPNRTALSAKDFLKAVIQAAPFRIQKCLTDNGSEFTDRFLTRTRQPSGTHEFDRLCTEQGIEHRLIPPGRPQTNGLVERFNGRIEEVLQTHHFDSTADLDTTLHRYVELYNHHIPQKALGHLTPIQALKNWQLSHPHLFRKKVYDRAGLDTYGAFLEVEASGWKGKNGIGTAIKLNKRLELFYRRVMERYSRLGGCEIHIMWHEEKPISVEFSLVIDGTLYTMKIGYDENYSFCSPGHLLREYIINYHEQKGDISFNNLITEAGWHHGWRPQSYNLFHYYLCSPSIRGRIAYMYQKALLKIRPVWLVLKPKLRNWNIIPGRPVRV